MVFGADLKSGVAARLYRWTIGAALLVVLAACAAPELLRPGTLDERMQTTQYRLVDVSRSWVYVPEGLLTLERDLGGTREQRVALPNRTVLSGDNFVLMRTRTSSGLRGARFNLDGFVKGAGGVPYPFQELTNSNMKTGSDALGDYFWRERNMGPGVVCVLAVRSLTRGAKPLPGNIDAVDILLRNCVTGSESDALRPILAQNVGAAAVAAPGAGQTRLQNLSPFAGPVAE